MSKIKDLLQFLIILPIDSIECTFHSVDHGVLGLQVLERTKPVSSSIF